MRTWYFSRHSFTGLNKSADSALAIGPDPVSKYAYRVSDNGQGLLVFHPDDWSAAFARSTALDALSATNTRFTGSSCPGRNVGSEKSSFDLVETNPQYEASRTGCP